MLLATYGIVFWIFAISFTLLVYKNKSGTSISTAVKVVPALSSIAFVFFSTSVSSLFYLLLLIAFVFCALGDIAMEYNLLPGLGMFLISHIIFTVDFATSSVVNGLSAPVVVFLSAFFLMMIYSILYHRYLMNAEEPTKLIRAIDVYALLISFTFSTSILLWLSTNNFLGFIPVVGAFFFVLSDSMIGILEFHHSFQFDRPITMVTYYVAIFLLCLSAIIY